MPRSKKAKPAPEAAPPSSPSSSSADDLDISDAPPAIDPYAVLSLDQSATADQVRSAYRRAALRHHPDKVPDADKAAAHTRFQEVAFAYAVLSNPARRARYDATGSTADSFASNDEDGLSWAEYFREQFRDAVSAEAIARFAAQYKGSDEERDDVLAAYDECAGDLDGVFERVMLCENGEDHERVRAVIDAAIARGDVERHAKYARENSKTRAKRAAKAKAEAEEAEEHARELGIHDKVFGAGTKKGGGQDPEAGLAALIQARQKQRNPDAFFDHLLDKYGPKGKSKGPGKKRTGADEDDEMQAEDDVPRAPKGRKKTKR